MRPPTLGTGTVYTLPTATVVHFGSPAGTSYDPAKDPEEYAKEIGLVLP
jgi:hypothetical protein